MGWQIQFQGEWGGQVAGSWRPAVTGTINQTGTPDEEASTFDSRNDAMAAFDNVIKVELPEVDDDRSNRPRFRLLDLESGDYERCDFNERTTMFNGFTTLNGLQPPRPLAIRETQLVDHAVSLAGKATEKTRDWRKYCKVLDWLLGGGAS